MNKRKVYNKRLKKIVMLSSFLTVIGLILLNSKSLQISTFIREDKTLNTENTSEISKYQLLLENVLTLEIKLS